MFQGRRTSPRSTTTGRGDRTTGGDRRRLERGQVKATSRASSARASARRAPATPARSAAGKTVTDFRIDERERDQRHRRHRDRLGPGARTRRSGRPRRGSPVTASRVRGRQSGSRRSPYQRRRELGAASRRSTIAPSVTSSSDRRSRIVAQVKAMSSHQWAAGTSTWKTASSSARAATDVMPCAVIVASREAERGDDPERVPRAVAPPRAAAAVAPARRRCGRRTGAPSGSAPSSSSATTCCAASEP